MTDTVIVYCSAPDTATSRTLARTVVEERLGAGANIIPGLQSVYHWQGEIEEAREELLLIETTADRYPALESRLRELHPYELPKIVAVPIEQGLAPYLDWVRTHSQTD